MPDSPPGALKRQGYEQEGPPMTPPTVCGACAHMADDHRTAAGHLRLAADGATVLEPHLPLTLATESGVNPGNGRPLHYAYAFWRGHPAPVASDTSNVSAEEAAAKLGRWLARWGSSIDRDMTRVHGEQAPASR